jgi:hypothetical protein
MSTHVVHNEKEFVRRYPYAKKYIKPEDHPKRYPVIMTVTTEGGGIMGEYEHVEFFYPPKEGTDKFIQGFKAGYNAA